MAHQKIMLDTYLKIEVEMAHPKIKVKMVMIKVEMAKVKMVKVTVKTANIVNHRLVENLSTACIDKTVNIVHRRWKNLSTACIDKTANNVHRRYKEFLVQCFKEGTAQEDPCRISCFFG